MISPAGKSICLLLERSFRVQNVEFRFGFYTTEGYIRGGEDSFYDSGKEEFFLRTGGEETQALLADFDELAFSHAAGKLMVKLKTPNGTVTSGEFVVTQTDGRGRHEGHTRWLAQTPRTSGSGGYCSSTNLTARRWQGAKRYRLSPQSDTRLVLSIRIVSHGTIY